MFEKLRGILGKVDADYADIRYETQRNSVISFNGKELNEIGSHVTNGYVMRVLKAGGMSSVVFTKDSDAEKAVRTALENAQIIAKNRETPVRLADVDVVRDTFIPSLKEDPREISLDEKLELVRSYVAIPIQREKIVTATIGYQDITREKYFLSAEGTEVHEHLITTRLFGEIVSRDGALLQNVRISAGGSDGFSTVRNQEENFERRTALAIDLLKARSVEGGLYKCILNPSLAGTFTHEAFGHFSEADLIENLPTMREKMKIGAKLGSDVVNIIDNPTLPGQLGFYRYDDEGVEVKPSQLMKEGVLMGRLHSRRTSATFGEPPTGHCVAEDYRYPPIVRMGTIFIEPGPQDFEELLTMLGDGLYILDSKGGATAGENFTFGAQYGYVVKKGKLGSMVRDINISGNLYQTLQNISAVGDDLVLRKQGGCGKGAQMNIRSCSGAPHILIDNLVIGGR